MLKRDITYEDFNGNEVTETFYFNISKPELLELEVEVPGGFGAMIQQVISAENNQAIVLMFKKIVLLARGVKSEDGKRFIKSDEDRIEFSQTAAYAALFMELATNDEAAALFLKGVLPKDVSVEMEKIEVVNAPVLGASPSTEE